MNAPLATSRPPPIIIDLQTPPMGGKCFLIEAKGLFVLERGPGVLRTIACTHAGAGSFEAVDGVPDEEGFFPDGQMPEWLEPTDEGELRNPSTRRPNPEYHRRNGRPVYRASPVVMGSWMLDAGFLHGLTLRAQGGHPSASAIASVVWMPFKARTVGGL